MTWNSARISRSATLLGALGLLFASPALLAQAPIGVSPGDAVEARRQPGSCPTFSWSGVPDSKGYELIIYSVAENGEMSELQQRRIPGGATSWTPSAPDCPPSGARYAWAVRASTEEGAGPWSQALFFETAGAPTDEEVRHALSVLRRHKGESRAPVVARSRGDSHQKGRVAPDQSGPPKTPLRLRPGGDVRGRLRPPGDLRDKPNLRALTSSTIAGKPSPPTVVTPGAFALDIDGDFDLGGHIFRDGVPFLHNDGGTYFRNTAVGINALVSATTGYPGGFAGGYNSAFGDSALRYTTEGNFNSAFGVKALEANTTGFSNLAAGSKALEANETGFYNTALGAFALNDNTAGNWNTATGAVSLLLNTTGSNNTATGGYALFYNTTGFSNVASGFRAMQQNDSGYKNSALGYESLRKNTTGNFNVGVGAYALYANTTGFRNSALGTAALARRSGEQGNTAFGFQALAYGDSGSGNTALGAYAGFWQEGDDNIAIGYGVVGFSGDDGTIRIGSSGYQTSTFIAGIHGTTTGGAAIPVLVSSSGQLGTVSSSARFKEDISDLAERSERLLELRPVAFRYRQAHDDGTKPLQYGLIAEEVAEIFPELVVNDEEGLPLTVRYDLLSTLLLNEVQRQKRERDVTQVAELEAWEALLAEVAELRATVTDQQRLLERLSTASISR